MQEDNIAIRLKLLISKLGINSSVFADNCGISRATLSQLLTGRNKKISDVLIGQIHKAYPNLSILWLLFNEGEMWTDDSGTCTPTTQEGSSGSITSDTTQAISNSDSPSDLSSTSMLDASTPYISPTNPFNPANFPTDGQVKGKYSEENGLNSSINRQHNLIGQQLDSSLATAGLINEIENLKSKIKKVVQITIYYDDSTFETFFPK